MHNILYLLQNINFKTCWAFMDYLNYVMYLCFLKEGFRQAMQMIGEEFLDRLEFYQSSWLPARAVVEEAVKKRLQVHSA